MKAIAGNPGGGAVSGGLAAIFDSLKGAGPPPGPPPGGAPGGNPWAAFAASFAAPDISRASFIPPTFDPMRPPTEAEIAKARAAGDEAQRAATRVFEQAFGASAASVPGTPANLLRTALAAAPPAAPPGSSTLPSTVFGTSQPGGSELKQGFFEDGPDGSAATGPRDPGVATLYPLSCPIHGAIVRGLGGAAR